MSLKSKFDVVLVQRKVFDMMKRYIVFQKNNYRTLERYSVMFSMRKFSDQTLKLIPEKK